MLTGKREIYKTLFTVAETWRFLFYHCTTDLLTIVALTFLKATPQQRFDSIAKCITLLCVAFSMSDISVLFHSKVFQIRFLTSFFAVFCVVFYTCYVQRVSATAIALSLQNLDFPPPACSVFVWILD